MIGLNIKSKISIEMTSFGAKMSINNKLKFIIISVAEGLSYSSLN
jgi:hypothetical protein